VLTGVEVAIPFEAIGLAVPMPMATSREGLTRALIR